MVRPIHAAPPAHTHFSQHVLNAQFPFAVTSPGEFELAVSLKAAAATAPVRFKLYRSDFETEAEAASTVAVFAGLRVWTAWA